MIYRIDMPSTISEQSIEDLFGLGKTSMPAMDVAEYDDKTVVVAELPGLGKDDVQLTFEKTILTISGERKPVEIPQDAKILVHEQHTRSFARSIRIGHQVDADNITATMENGILTVALPKSAAALPKTIEVK